MCLAQGKGLRHGNPGKVSATKSTSPDMLGFSILPYGLTPFKSVFPILPWGVMIKIFPKGSFESKEGPRWKTLP